VFGLLGVGIAKADVINVDFESDAFNTFNHGDVVDAIVTSAGNIGVSAVNTGGGPPLAVIMNSGLDHSAASGDPDLEAPFGNPNTPGGAISALPSNMPGNILIIQENGPCNDETCLPTSPDDEAGGGFITFDFAGILVDGVTITYVDIIDIDNGNSSETVDIELFYAVGGSSGPAQFDGSEIGDRNGARIDLVEAFEGANNGVSSMRLTFSSSGATAGFQISSVPEPASLVLLGIGLLGLGIGHRRRRVH